MPIAQLIDATKIASTDAFHLAMLVSALLLLAGAVANGIGIRNQQDRKGSAGTVH